MDPAPEAEEDRKFSIETDGPYLHATGTLESASRAQVIFERKSIPIS